VCNGLYSSERDTAWENDVETEKECDRQKGESSKVIQLIERTELISGETCVTVSIAVRGIQRGKMM
jgi:hypothetical protein